MDLSQLSDEELEQKRRELSGIVQGKKTRAEPVETVRVGRVIEGLGPDATPEEKSRHYRNAGKTTHGSEAFALQGINSASFGNAEGILASQERHNGILAPVTGGEASMPGAQDILDLLSPTGSVVTPYLRDKARALFDDDFQAEDEARQAELKEQRLTAAAENPNSAMAGEVAGYLAPGGMLWGGGTKATRAAAKNFVAPSVKQALTPRGSGTLSKVGRYSKDILGPSAVASALDYGLYESTVGASNMEDDATVGDRVGRFGSALTNPVAYAAGPSMSLLYRAGRGITTAGRNTLEASREANRVSRETTPHDPNAKGRARTKAKNRAPGGTGALPESAADDAVETVDAVPVSDNPNAKGRARKKAPLKIKFQGGTFTPTDRQVEVLKQLDGLDPKGAREKALEMIEKRMRKNGMTTDDIRQKIAGFHYAGYSSVDEMLFELAGAGNDQLAVALGTVGGRAKEIFKERLDARSETALERIRSELHAALDIEGSDFYGLQEDLYKKRLELPKEGYEKAYATPIDQLTWRQDILPAIDSPFGRIALDDAADYAESVGELASARRLRELSEALAGDTKKTPPLHARDIDYVDRMLGDMAAGIRKTQGRHEKARGPMSAQNRLRNGTQGFRGGFDELTGIKMPRDMAAEYRAAGGLSGYELDAGEVGALQFGRAAAKNGTDLETLTKEFAHRAEKYGIDGEQSDIIRGALLEGWLRGAEDMIETSTTPGQIIRKLYGNERQRAKLNAMLPRLADDASSGLKSDRTKQIRALTGGKRTDGKQHAGRFEREADFEWNRNRVSYNSQTAQRTEAVAEQGGTQDKLGRLTQAVFQTPRAWVANMAEAGVRRLARPGIYNDAINKELGEILTTSQQKPLLSILDEIDELVERKARGGAPDGGGGGTSAAGFVPGAEALPDMDRDTFMELVKEGMDQARRDDIGPDEQEAYAYAFAKLAAAREGFAPPGDARRSNLGIRQDAALFLSGAAVGAAPPADTPEERFQRAVGVGAMAATAGRFDRSRAARRGKTRAKSGEKSKKPRSGETVGMSMTGKRGLDRAMKAETPGTPEYEAAKAKGLDMTQAGRMQRAKEMGFDTDTVLYHGTADDFKEFSANEGGKTTLADSGKGAFYFTTLSDDAETYAGYASRSESALAEGRFGENQAILPVYIRKGKEFIFENTSGDKTILSEDIKQKAIRDAKAAGYDSVRFVNYADSVGDSTGHWRGNEIVAIFDPANIRSVNAAFDPDNAASANLLAGVKGDLVEGPASAVASGLRKIHQRVSDPKDPRHFTRDLQDADLKREVDGVPAMERAKNPGPAADRVGRFAAQAERQSERSRPTQTLDNAQRQVQEFLNRAESEAAMLDELNRSRSPVAREVARTTRAHREAMTALSQAIDSGALYEGTKKARKARQMELLRAVNRAADDLKQAEAALESMPKKPKSARVDTAQMVAAAMDAQEAVRRLALEQHNSRVALAADGMTGKRRGKDRKVVLENSPEALKVGSRPMGDQPVLEAARRVNARAGAGRESIEPSIGQREAEREAEFIDLMLNPARAKEARRIAQEGREFPTYENTARFLVYGSAGLPLAVQGVMYKLNQIEREKVEREVEADARRLQQLESLRNPRRAEDLSEELSRVEVKRIQAFLNTKLGAELEVDGVFGKGSKQALRVWQDMNDLESNGALDVETMKEINEQFYLDMIREFGEDGSTPDLPDTQPEKVKTGRRRKTQSGR